MQFIHTQHPPDDGREIGRTAYLVRDNWDDFGFKTAFGILLVDNGGIKHDLGSVRIMTAGMTDGYVELPQTFNEPLPANYCSLGNGQNYYETLYELPSDLRQEYLTFIRDCVYDPEIWEQFQDEEAMRASLLRNVDSRTVEITYRGLLIGHAAPTEYHFTYQAQYAGDEDSGGFSIDFKVSPRSIPPTNVHAIIGRNGVGKTTLFESMFHALIGTEPEVGIPLLGEVKFEEDWLENSETFANLVMVGFSAFDSFLPLDKNDRIDRISHDYVGLKSRIGDAKNIELKRPDQLTSDFVNSLEKCLSEPRRTRWLNTMVVLSSDSGLRDLQVPQVFSDSSNDEILSYLKGQFDQLSSGHKIVLLTITRLVELVDDHTLVLIDEPESHLHPPLLGSFIRAVSELLTTRNAVGILATHSPVVLQEVPKNCVTVMTRSGDTIWVSRPEEETFAENVGILTREAFKLEVTESGYHRMLAMASQGATYNEVLEHFGGEIGAEGRAIVRALTSRNEDN